MTIKEYKTFFTNQLLPFYDAMEVASFFYMILEHRLHLRRIDLALNPEIPIDDSEKMFWDDILRQLQKQIPIQYILGTAHFFGLQFEVNKHVLIPRPETEELVQLIIDDCHKHRLDSPAILDIGTGSGCIAIALSKNLTDAKVTAIDISKEALATAKRNAETNKVNVNFKITDILTSKDLDKNYSTIVSNPPYVRALEKAEIKSNVLDYEPHLALFVEDFDPLLFYRKIADLAQRHLIQNGKLYFEINQYLGREMITLLHDNGFVDVELRKDIYGNDRMIRATRP